MDAADITVTAVVVCMRMYVTVYQLCVCVNIAYVMLCY